MLLGMPIIRNCSNCSGLIKQHSYISVNSIGAKFWTDGKMKAPMCPEQPRFVICPHCQSAIWIYEQGEVDIEKVEIVKPLSKIELVRSLVTNAISEQELEESAELYRKPKLNDYFKELNRSNIDREKERYLRLRLWWLGNDKRRGIGDAKHDLSDKEEKNLEKLYKILNYSDDNDRIIMAEIKRELGEFKDAEAIIKKPFANKFAHTVVTIKQLIKKQETYVAEIKSS